MTCVSNPDLVVPDLTREFCGWNHGPRIAFHRSTFLAHIFCTLIYFDPQNASEKVGKNMPAHQFVLSARPYLLRHFWVSSYILPKLHPVSGEKSCYIERPFRTAFARYRGLQIESLRFRPFEASVASVTNWSRGFALTLAELMMVIYIYTFIDIYSDVFFFRKPP